MNNNDPLNILIRWPDVIREDVRDALLPHVGILRWSGDLKFLRQVDDKELLSKLHRLGNAAAVEMGASDIFENHLFAEEAEELAHQIIEITDD